MLAQIKNDNDIAITNYESRDRLTNKRKKIEYSSYEV